MSNIADVPDGCDWNGQQCDQCGNPVIEGEGIGPENSLCSECWIDEDASQCPYCGEFVTEEEFDEGDFHNQGHCSNC